MMLLSIGAKRRVAKLLLMVLITHLCFNISAQSIGKVVPKINLSVKNMKLGQVFRAIRKQTGMTVWYKNQDVDENAHVKDVEFQNASIDDVMRACIGENFMWDIQGNNVIVHLKSEGAKTNNNPKSVYNEKDENTLMKTRDSLPGTITVTGNVTDIKGSPIVGATVVAKGMRNGTYTKEDGSFRLDNVKPGTLLTLSSVGFLAQEVDIRGKSYVSIHMKEYVGNLDETVVLAYGVTTKRYNTGNVGSIKAKEIETQPVSNPLLALQGRVPGLLISQQAGVSGGGISISIQGLNSIGKGNDPFYVIDGVPYSSQLLPNDGGILKLSGATPSGSFNSAYGSPLSFINPSDIESIEVLKDADATAIYGSRAANGAILITTKKGKPGEGKVEFNIRTGWAAVAKKNDLLNRRQYLDMRYEALKNDGFSAPRNSDYDLKVWDTTRTTDWQKTLIGNSARYTDVNGTISGGNTITQYLIGGTYHKETTVFPGSFNDQRGAVHFNVNSSLFNNKLSVQFSGNYMTDDNKLPVNDLTYYATLLAPTAPELYNTDGSLNWETNANGSSTWVNPLSFSRQKYNVKTNNLLASSYLKYNLSPGLALSSNLGYTNLTSNDISTYPFEALAPESKPYSHRTGFYTNNNIKTWIIEPQLTYNRSFGNVKTDILLGTTFQENISQGQRLQGTDFGTDASIADMASAASLTAYSTINSVYKYGALFGRINLNVKERYIINLTGRRDGSSRFGSKNQFHDFGAIGLAWIFSEEDWFKNNLPFISFGKLRGSYGTTGNDQIGDYQFLSLYSPISVDVPFQDAKGYLPNGLPNPYLAWEETKKIQMGLDLGVIKDKILLTVSYYRNRSSNQLVSYSLPIITGFGGVTQNFGATVQNTGWEIALQANIITSKNFRWSSNSNITVPRNKLLSFPGISSSTYNFFLTVGQPLTITRVYPYAGVNSDNGLYQFYDSHGSLTTSPNALVDKIISINTSPSYYGGIMNSFVYKAFSLDLFIQYTKQIGKNNFLGTNPGTSANQPIEVLDRWRNIGNAATHSKFSTTSLSARNYRNALASNIAYSDASFIRLKNIQLSWRLPVELRKNIHIKDLNVFIQGQNVLTFTKFNQLDPESRSSVTLPPLREILIGMKVTL